MAFCEQIGERERQGYMEMMITVRRIIFLQVNEISVNYKAPLNLCVGLLSIGVG